jgi:hypothetical protein
MTLSMRREKGKERATAHYLTGEWMGWTEGFEPSISRATTWRLNRSATPTRIGTPCGLDSPPADRSDTPTGAVVPLGRVLSLV